MLEDVADVEAATAVDVEDRVHDLAVVLVRLSDEGGAEDVLDPLEFGGGVVHVQLGDQVVDLVGRGGEGGRLRARAEGPDDPMRVAEDAVVGAPELGGHLDEAGGALLQGFGFDREGVLDVEVEGNLGLLNVIQAEMLGGQKVQVGIVDDEVMTIDEAAVVHHFLGLVFRSPVEKGFRSFAKRFDQELIIASSIAAAYS